eukprot:TRINITY_DN322_c1_g1_i3.p1 TRINITY_DN322_c1_g1~~TRINITY_DN322_c1_g1_i3.p1  ORF type:complete len:1101 (+),score=606.51 TRINITY_DN322_c1_g1_i3:98-3400(+)
MSAEEKDKKSKTSRKILGRKKQSPAMATISSTRGMTSAASTSTLSSSPKAEPGSPSGDLSNNWRLSWSPNAAVSHLGLGAQSHSPTPRSPAAPSSSSSSSEGVFKKRTANSHTFIRVAGDNSGSVLQNFFYGAFGSLFEAMALDDDQIQQCFAQLDYALTPQQHMRLQNDNILPDTAKATLKTLVDQIQRLFVSDGKAAPVIKAQSVIRGWLMRRRFQALSEAQLDKLIIRNTKFFHFLNSERENNTRLRRLVDFYIKPLQAHPIKGLTAVDIEYLFANAEQLLQVNRELLDFLDQLTRSTKLPFFTDLGDKFSSLSAELLSAYGFYSENHFISMAVLGRLTESNPKFIQFLDEVATEFGDRITGVDTLKQLLSHPLIHFSKYESKLKSIQQTFSEEDVGAEGMHSAIELIGAASDLIKSKFEVAKRRLVSPILAFESRLEVDEPLLLLRASNRRLIREGNCKTERKNSFAVLFNDILILTEPTGTGNGLRPISLIDMQDVAIGDDKEKDKITLQIASGDVTMTFKTESEKKDWYIELQSISEYFQRNKVFGAPLEATLKKERRKGVPLVMEQTTNWIKEHGQEAEGLFRVPGITAKVTTFKKLYDTDQSSQINFIDGTVHDVAGLLKLYLRELPEPLFLFSSYDKVIRMHNLLTEKGDAHLPIIKDQLSDILVDLPPHNVEALLVLSNFLLHMSQYSQRTKMDVDNLAMVFAPNIIRPKEDTFETAMHSEKIKAIFGILITDAETIFAKARAMIAKREEDEENEKEKERQKKIAAQAVDKAPPSPEQEKPEKKAKSKKPASLERRDSSKFSERDGDKDKEKDKEKKPKKPRSSSLLDTTPASPSPSSPSPSTPDEDPRKRRKMPRKDESIFGESTEVLFSKATSGSNLLSSMPSTPSPKKPSSSSSSSTPSSSKKKSSKDKSSSTSSSRPKVKKSTVSIPTAFRVLTEAILTTNEASRYFSAFMTQRNGYEYLKFYLAVSVYKKNPSEEKRNEVIGNFLDPLSPALVTIPESALSPIFTSDSTSPDLFDPVSEPCFVQLFSDVPVFIQSGIFKACINETFHQQFAEVIDVVKRATEEDIAKLVQVDKNGDGESSSDASS